MSDYSDPVRRLIINLSSATGKFIKPETSSLYESRLSRFPLTPTQWARVCSIAIYQFDSFPSLSQLYPVVRKVWGDNNIEQIPLWRTWRDADGRCYAQKIGTQDAYPGPHTIEQWKLEACTPEEGRAEFMRCYCEAGSNMAAITGIIANLAPEPVAVMDDDEIPF